MYLGDSRMRGFSFCMFVLKQSFLVVLVSSSFVQSEVSMSNPLQHLWYVACSVHGCDWQRKNVCTQYCAKHHQVYIGFLSLLDKRANNIPIPQEEAPPPPPEQPLALPAPAAQRMEAGGPQPPPGIDKPVAQQLADEIQDLRNQIDDLRATLARVRHTLRQRGIDSEEP